MALLQDNYLTLLDQATRIDPDGSTPVIVEMLSQDNPMLEEMPFMKGNLVTGHKTTVRTGLPQGTWRKLYQGVQPTKSTTDNVTETIGNLEAFSEVDYDLADMAENEAEFRLSESTAFMEGLGQQIASTLFYGNTDVHPERFMGFAPRYNTLDEQEAKNAVNVIDAGGTGNNNTSIWLVGWGSKKVCGILPKNTDKGAGAICHEDMGTELIQKNDGSKYKALIDHYKIQMGLCVEDWRYVVRIANIDVTQLQANFKDGGADLFLLLSRAFERLHGETANTRIYANRTITSFLREQQIRQQTVRIKTDMVEGRKVTHLDGTTISRSDALLNTEAALTGA